VRVQLHYILKSYYGIYSFSLLGEIVENLGAVRDPLVVGRAILTEADIIWDENFSKEVLDTLKCKSSCWLIYNWSYVIS